jgi:hypothetical protein
MNNDVIDMKKIRIRAQEIRQTCEMEYPEAGDEALWQMAVDTKWLGLTEAEVDALLSELGF